MDNWSFHKQINPYIAPYFTFNGLDFLVGNIDLELSDKLMNRITEVSKMTEKDKDHVFTLLEAFIARTKMQGFV